MDLFARTTPPGGNENRWWKKINQTGGGLPEPPEKGAAVLQSVDGVLQWVTTPTLLAVNEGNK